MYQGSSQFPQAVGHGLGSFLACRTPSDLVFPGAGATAGLATASLDQITVARPTNLARAVASGRLATMPVTIQGITDRVVSRLIMSEYPAENERGSPVYRLFASI